jgi:hypothetical protein
MAELAVETSVQKKEDSFSPSWVDRLIGWIDDLPGPAWAFYVAATLVLTLLINLVMWIDGSVPLGTYAAIPGLFPPFIFYFLVLYHYLTRVASRSLQAFRPLLDANEAEITKIERDLTSLPRTSGWWSIVIGLLTTPPYVVGDRSLAFQDLVPQTALPYIFVVIVSTLYGATFFALFIRSIRQLRLVRKLHAQAVNVDLMKLSPAHAFSALTARTGIGFAFLIVLGYLYDPSNFNADWYMLYIVISIILAAVVFVLPVIGMRDRLEEVKGQLLDKTNKLLQTTEDRFHSKVENSDYAELRGMETAIDMLIHERERISRISTWPWNPATFRAFGSTLLLPILLRILTQLVGNFF